MGAFEPSEGKDDIIIVRNEKGWDSHESCRIRTFVRAEDREWVENQLLLLEQEKRKQSKWKRQEAGGIEIKNNLAAANRLWVQRMIVDWTFTKGGVVMPLQPANERSRSMRLLHDDYIEYIYRAFADAQPDTDDPTPPEENNEESEEDQDQSNFTGGASASTDGEMTSDEERQGQTSSRNYLLKS